MQRSGLAFLHLMMLDLDELQWAAAEAAFDDSASMGWVTDGLVVPNGIGGLGQSWSVSDDDNDGSIVVQTHDDGALGHPTLAFAVDSDGSPRAARKDESTLQPIALTNDNTWRTVLMHWALTEYEPGTVNFTGGSTTITGTNTVFDRLSGRDDGVYERGTKLLVEDADSANGNEGEYELATVVTATQATVRTAPAGTSETGVPFKVIGRFAGDTPADAVVHRRWVPVIEVVALTRAPAAGYYALADVRRNDGNATKVEIIDRRAGSLARMRSMPRTTPTMAMQSVYDAEAGTFAPSVIEVVEASDNVLSLAPADDGTMLMLLLSGSTLVTRRWIQTMTTTSWSSASPSIVTASNGCLLKLQRTTVQSGPSHAVFYRDSGQVFARTTDNAGTSWDAPISVWDTATGGSQLPLTAIQLPSGRIIVSTTKGEKAVFIYSDDYMASWETNSGDGFTLSDWSPGAGSTEIRVLAQCVGPDGRIWTAVQDSDTDDSGLIISSQSLTPAPTTTSTPTYSLAAFTGDAARVAALHAAGGAVVATCFEPRNSPGATVFTMTLFCAPGDDAIVIASRQDLVEGDAGNDLQACSAGMAINGDLHIAYTDFRDADPSKVRHFRFSQMLAGV